MTTQHRLEFLTTSSNPDEHRALACAVYEKPHVHSKSAAVSRALRDGLI